MLQDHLGSTRVVFSDVNNDGSVDASEILSQESYYPFGLEMKGNWNSSSKYNYLYTGQERQKRFSLGYDRFDARFYDSWSARFMGVDPISDQFPELSTYSYAGNSPISNIDMWGLQPLFAANGNIIAYQVQQGQGPTQIAEDINQNHSESINGPIDFTTVVFGNIDDFQNVVEGRGMVFDEFNLDFRSGNINPEDVLLIPNGFGNAAELDELKILLDKAKNGLQLSESEIRVLSRWKDAADAQVKEYEQLTSRGDPFSGAAGARLGNQLLSNIKIGQIRKELELLLFWQRQADSLQNEIDNLDTRFRDEQEK